MKYMYWAELWLANNIFYTVWGKIQPLKRMLTLLDFGSFLKVPKSVGKSSACPVGVFSMLPNPPKCHIRHKSGKSTMFIIKLKILYCREWWPYGPQTPFLKDLPRNNYAENSFPNTSCAFTTRTPVRGVDQYTFADKCSNTCNLQWKGDLVFTRPSKQQPNTMLQQAPAQDNA